MGKNPINVDLLDGRFFQRLGKVSYKHSISVQFAYRLPFFVNKTQLKKDEYNQSGSIP